MGLFDLFKKKKHIVEIKGNNVDLDQYYETNWNLFPSMMNNTELDYELIEHYARYYRDFETQCAYRASRIIDDSMNYAVDTESFGVKLPIKLENYMGRTNCIQDILADIKKCEDMIEEKAAIVVEERRKAEAKRQREIAEKEERERIIPAEKVELSPKVIEFVLGSKEFIENFIKAAKQSRKANSRERYSSDILYDLPEETKERTINMVVETQMKFEELVKKERNELVRKATLKTGYPKEYVATVEEILFMISRYDGNEAFDYNDLDTVVMYVMMHPNDFKKSLVEWATIAQKDLVTSSIKK